MTKLRAPAIVLEKVSTRFGTHIVHSELDLEVHHGEVFALAGGSGSGKSTLLREMILLQRPDAGTIRILGQNLTTLSEEDALELRLRCGVMFQHGGLFSALTVTENLGLPLREHTLLDGTMIDEIVAWKLAMTGLDPKVGAQYPGELSGGMLKRASLARAIALDPELLFLDEPTAGLDPASAEGVETLVCKLRDLFDLTIVMVTHDLDLMWNVTDRVAVLDRGKMDAIGTMAALSKSTATAVRPLFDGTRGRSAREHMQAQRESPANEPTEGSPSKPK